jgi:extracellular solute-binding protein (family 5)
MPNLARILAGAAAAGLLCGALACTPKPAPSGQPPTDDPCMLLPGKAEAFGSVTVALTDDVDISRAPVPRNTSERLLFGLLYETLIRVDCTGRVLPQLAERWESVAGGREWRFTLRAGARFWDGSPVTAQDVVSTWWATDPGRGAAARVPWIGPEAANAAGDRLVAVTLKEPRASVPVEFADPQFAVTKLSDSWGWPLGTGSRRPSGPFVQVGVKDTRPVIIAYPTSTSSMFLRFLLASGSDSRDLLDARVDLLVADRHAREYSATLPDFVAVPLPRDSALRCQQRRVMGSRATSCVRTDVARNHRSGGSSLRNAPSCSAASRSRVRLRRRAGSSTRRTIQKHARWPSGS